MVVLLSLHAQVEAAPKMPESATFGMGFHVGEPIGFTAKAWLNDMHALDVLAGYSFSNYFQFHFDYLFHFTEFKQEDFEGQVQSRIKPYLGLGGGILVSSVARANPVRALIRFPVGIEWLQKNAQFGIFIEAVPALMIHSDLRFIMNGAVGIRFYFQ
jgi:hypothetical protein